MTPAAGSNTAPWSHHLEATEDSRPAVPSYEEHIHDAPFCGDPSPPPYSTIDDQGNLHHARNQDPTLPIATTVEGALVYSSGFGGNSISESTAGEFHQSTKFSPEQKAGLQKIYSKYFMPIGMARRLEKLIGHRMEFILDDSKNSSAQDLQGMKAKIRQMAEFLQYIPNAGISIRTLSGQHIQFNVDEKNPGKFFSDFENRLNAIKPSAANARPLTQVYEACVGSAVRNEQKTAVYVFTRGKELGKRALFFENTQQKNTAAKALTKAIVNRPDELTPTVLFPHTADLKKIKIMNNLDSVCSKVNTVQSFGKEKNQIQARQGRLFPYTEGMHLQGALLGAVDPFWDQMDEGRIFGKKDLEAELAVPLDQREYDRYFDETYQLQHNQFLKDEAAQEKASAKRKDKATALLSTGVLSFATTTTDPAVDNVPSMRKAIDALRKSPGYTEELEAGINKVCTGLNIPIGLGIHLAKLGEHRLEFIIDNSGSMNLPAQEGRLLGPSRMDELKERLCALAPILAAIPNQGVTVRVLNKDLGHGYGSAPGPVMNFSRENYKTPEAFTRHFQECINKISIAGSTPLNEIFGDCIKKAEQHQGKTAAYIFTDGAPDGGSEGIKQFVKATANRPHEKMPLTFCPCTDDESAVAWTNFAEQVCSNTNSIDDYNSEKTEVAGKQGNTFPYNKNIYLLATLLGGISPLFDGMDENRLYSKKGLEEITGNPVDSKTYDNYFDEGYERQCQQDTRKLVVPSVTTWNDWAAKAPESAESSRARNDRARFEACALQ